MALTESYWPAAHDPPLLDTTVGGVLRQAAAEAGDRPALLATSVLDMQLRRWTYAELLRDSEQVAAALLQHFQPGERVAVWAPNLAEWELLEFGCALAGIVLVTVNPAFRDREVEYVLRQSRAVGLFHVGKYRGNPMAATVDTIRPSLPELRDVIALEEWPSFVGAVGAVADAAAVELPDVQPHDPVQIQYTSGTTGFPKGALLHHHGITNNARLTA
jgi:fatty-acyl-CoA synthase